MGALSLQFFMGRRHNHRQANSHSQPVGGGAPTVNRDRTSLAKRPVLARSTSQIWALPDLSMRSQGSTRHAAASRLIPASTRRRATLSNQSHDESSVAGSTTLGSTSQRHGGELVVSETGQTDTNHVSSQESPRVHRPVADAKRVRSG
jgi:hypothetical protein